MEYFIFNYTNDVKLIDSFLHSASLAHKQPKRTESWFLWKFRDNPFGETVLACAKKDDKIVGCVAYGMQNFILGNKIVKGAISFETFVHPDYQGQGLFSKLIEIAEIRAHKLNVDFLLNFPNRNSLKGFLSKGWKTINTAEYWIKGKNWITIPFKVLDLKTSFTPFPSNLKDLSPPVNFDFTPSNFFEMEITQDYLKWRFFTFPNAKYYFSETDSCDAMCRVGKRGSLIEAQVLFVNIKESKKFKLSNLLNRIKENTDYDIVSFPISNTNGLRSLLKTSFFIKVPNSTNVGYKILNTDLIWGEQIERISLSAINYHTY